MIEYLILIVLSGFAIASAYIGVTTWYDIIKANTPSAVGKFDESKGFS